MLDLARNIENLPLHLLRTLFKSQRSDSSNFHAQLKKDLQLTIDWNCPELALTKVFYIDATFKVDNDIFDQALLERGREDFVSLFLDNGFEIDKYLSAGRLVILFEKALKEDFFREVCWEGVLAYGKAVALDYYFIDADLNWIIESLIGISYFVSSQELNNNSVGLYSSTIPRHIAPDVAKRKAIIVLFIWALVSNRGKLAICLWRHVDHPIMSALAASLILDKIRIYIHEKKTQDQIVQLSKEFASMAIGVFDLCYNDMPSKAYDLLSAKYEDWSKRSLIDMASLAENRAFVAHPCCQKWLTNKFMGNIKIRELTWGFMTFPVYIKVILCAFFVFPMYLWVRFKESTVHEYVGGDGLLKADFCKKNTETFNGRSNETLEVKYEKLN